VLGFGFIVAYWDCLVFGYVVFVGLFVGIDGEPGPFRECVGSEDYFGTFTIGA